MALQDAVIHAIANDQVPINPDAAALNQAASWPDSTTCGSAGWTALSGMACTA